MNVRQLPSAIVQQRKMLNSSNSDTSLRFRNSVVRKAWTESPNAIPIYVIAMGKALVCKDVKLVGTAPLATIS